VLVLVGHLSFVSPVLVRDVTNALVSAVIKGHLVRALGPVLVTLLLDVEDCALIVVIYRVGVLVQPGLVRILRRGEGGGLVLVFMRVVMDIVERGGHHLGDEVGGGMKVVRGSAVQRGVYWQVMSVVSSYGHHCSSRRGSRVDLHWSGRVVGFRRWGMVSFRSWLVKLRSWRMVGFWSWCMIGFWSREVRFWSWSMVGFWSWLVRFWSWCMIGFWSWVVRFWSWVVRFWSRSMVWFWSWVIRFWSWVVRFWSWSMVGFWSWVVGFYWWRGVIRLDWRSIVDRSRFV